MAGNRRGGGQAASIYAPERWSQRNQRAEQMWEDDHGREWFGAIELKTGDVVGLLQPQFTAPLIPDQKYLKRVYRKPYTLHIDYIQWQKDVEAEIKNWYDEGRKRAQKIHGSQYDPRAEFSSEVLDIIGPKPPAVDPIIAARQGNRWVLGLTKKVDERLAAFFAPEELDFELRRENEPDYSDRYIDRSKPSVGRGGAHGNSEKEIVVPGGRTVPMQSSRPSRSRGEGKETHTRAARPKTGASNGSGAPRERYKKPHPKAGQFIPQGELQEA